MKFKSLFLALLFLYPAAKSYAGFANYNSILIGERAAGMGGAFTALSGDSAGGSFYNPASLARMEGSSLSATVSVFNKFDTKFGSFDDFDKAPLRINQGSIVPIPASSGSVHTFGNLAFGLSIIIPDFDIYSGDIRSTDTSSATINLRDESLWVGGTAAVNLTEKDSLGLTMYYTSRTYNRRLKDQDTSAGQTTIITQEKYYAVNSLIYVFGYYRQLAPHWSFGLSWRAPSLQITGRGSYYQSEISTTTGLTNPINATDVAAVTEVPMRTALGIAYQLPRVLTVSFDVNHYGQASYTDLKHEVGGDLVEHSPTWNVSAGAEFFFRDWLALRMGGYTNLSSHPKIRDQPTFRQSDHIDMWGLSANIGLYTSNSSTVTLGGYYTGGKGSSVQLVAGELEKINKSLQIFSFLVGTSFQF